MEYRYLGSTGLKVAAIGLGCMTFGPRRQADEAGLSMLDRYVEVGGNFLDMADNYPGVEQLLGRWLKDRSNRRQIILCTKVRRFHRKRSQRQGPYPQAHHGFG